MGKYLTFANECIQKFKPVIEERTGTKLEDLVVKDTPPGPELITIDYSDKLMFVTPCYPHTVFMNENKYYHNKMESSIPRHVTHEICHLIHNKLVKDKTKRTNSKIRNLWTLNRYHSRKSFREGFCEYMSLDYLADLYDKQTLEETWRIKAWNASYQDFSTKLIPYERGYKFFRKVLSVVGKDKILEVARSPPLAEIEVKTPLLYLLRRYPTKGIKSIPKFFIKGMRTKLIKTLYGYAPLDF